MNGRRPRVDGSVRVGGVRARRRRLRSVHDPSESVDETDNLRGSLSHFRNLVGVRFRTRKTLLKLSIPFSERAEYPAMSDDFLQGVLSYSYLLCIAGCIRRWPIISKSSRN